MLYTACARRQGAMQDVISTDAAPAAVGAYSQATMTDGLVYTAGQLPMTPEGDLLTDASVAEQTTRCLQNIEAVLAAVDLSMAAVIKTTVFLADIGTFDEFNAAYGEFFPEQPPARSAVEVGAVPKGAAVEIEAVAAR